MTETESQSPPRFALFAYGFRPFFLAAGLFGAVSVPLWLALYGGGMADTLLPLPASLWHAHEMLFGYGAAAVAGFFLTVVPNWTGRAAYRGPVLMGLLALWLLGRVVYWTGGAFSPWLVAGADLAFLLALIAVTAPPLLAPQYRTRQFIFIPILAVMVAGNALITLEMLEITETGTRGVRLALDALILLMTVMGGRVTPSFTSSFLGHDGDPAIRVVQRPGLERAVLAGTLGLLVVDQVAPESLFAGLYLLVLAGLHGWRMAGWQTVRTLKNPILWALHLGYGWLVVGFALRALAFIGDAAGGGGLFDAAAADHAITIGAVGGLTLAVMTRASLGHTGRAITAPGPIIWSYWLVAGAALARVLVAVVPTWTAQLVTASGALWTLAFVLFCIVYLPILIGPRVDGREG